MQSVYGFCFGLSHFSRSLMSKSAKEFYTLLGVIVVLALVLAVLAVAR